MKNKGLVIPLVILISMFMVVPCSAVATIDTGKQPIGMVYILKGTEGLPDHIFILAFYYDENTVYGIELIPGTDVRYIVRGYYEYDAINGLNYFKLITVQLPPEDPEWADWKRLNGVMNLNTRGVHGVMCVYSDGWLITTNFEMRIIRMIPLIMPTMEVGIQKTIENIANTYV